MRRNPTDAEGQKALNLSEASCLIAHKCGGRAPGPRVLQRHCHAGRLDYFRIADARPFLTTEAWVLAYLEGDTVAGSVARPASLDRERRARHAVARRQIRQAGEEGGRR